MAGKLWRTGANEATVFEVSKAVKVEGNDLPAGKYALFTIANQESGLSFLIKPGNRKELIIIKKRMMP